MPYNTSWKDGMLVKNHETPNPLNKNSNNVENGPQSKVCKLPHMSEKFLISMSMLEEENHHKKNHQTINALSFEPFWGEDDSSCQN